MSIATFQDFALLGKKGKVFDTPPYSPPVTKQWYEYTTAELYTELNSWSSSGSPTVSKITPTGTGTMERFWQSAVLAPNGKIYIAPTATNDTGITVFDPSTETYSVISIGRTYSSNNGFNMGVLAGNGKIYWPPYVTTDYSDWLILDTSDDSFTFTNYSQTYTGRAFTSVCYHPPTDTIHAGGSEASYAYIDVSTDTYTTTTYGGTSSVGFLEHFDAVIGADDKIYYGPFNTGNLYAIDPATNTATNAVTGYATSQTENLTAARGNVVIGARRSNPSMIVYDTDTSTDSAPSKGFLTTGASVGTDGNAYFPNFNTTYAGQYDPDTDTFTNIGSLSSFRGRGLVLALNGYLYGGDQDSANLLKIDPNGSGSVASGAGEAVALSGLTNGR